MNVLFSTTYIFIAIFHRSITKHWKQEKGWELSSFQRKGMASLTADFFWRRNRHKNNCPCRWTETKSVFVASFFYHTVGQSVSHLINTGLVYVCKPVACFVQIHHGMATIWLHDKEISSVDYNRYPSRCYGTDCSECPTDTSRYDSHYSNNHSSHNLHYSSNHSSDD